MTFPAWIGLLLLVVILSTVLTLIAIAHHLNKSESRVLRKEKR